MKQDHHAIWQGRLDAFERSGLTPTRFCEQERISTASFYSWRRRLGRIPSDRTPKVEFVEVGGDDRPGSIELIVAKGIVVRVGRGFDAATLERVLDVIAGRK